MVVVEDDIAIRHDVQRLLKGTTFAVHCASNDDEAVLVLDRIAPPCLLLWGPTSIGQFESILARASRDGFRVAALPIVLERVPGGGAEQGLRKRLVSPDIVVSLVREACEAEPALAEQV